MGTDRAQFEAARPAADGRPRPTTTEPLSAESSDDDRGEAAETLAGLRALHDAHLIVLERDRGRLVVAHPRASDFLGLVVA